MGLFVFFQNGFCLKTRTFFVLNNSVFGDVLLDLDRFLGLKTRCVFFVFGFRQVFFFLLEILKETFEDGAMIGDDVC